MHFEGTVADQRARATRSGRSSSIPNQVGQCGPGVESIEVIDDDPFQGDGQGRRSGSSARGSTWTWSSPSTTRPDRGDDQGPRPGARAAPSTRPRRCTCPTADGRHDGHGLVGRREHRRHARQRRRAADRGHGQQDDRPDLRLHADEARGRLTDLAHRGWNASSRVVGPVATNVHVLADPRTREAIAIDTATPSLAWIADELAARDWTLKLIVSTPRPLGPHRRQRRGRRAHRRRDRRPSARPRSARSTRSRCYAPFEIPPSVPAVELAEGGEVRFGEIRLRVLHTPGHTEGSVCLLAADDGLLFSGDTLFAGGWGRVDLPGGDPDAMVESLGRLPGARGPRAGLPGSRARDDDRPRARLAGARPRRRPTPGLT